MALMGVPWGLYGWALCLHSESLGSILSLWAVASGLLVICAYLRTARGANSSLCLLALWFARDSTKVESCAKAVERCSVARERSSPIAWWGDIALAFVVYSLVFFLLAVSYDAPEQATSSTIPSTARNRPSTHAATRPTSSSTKWATPPSLSTRAAIPPTSATTASTAWSGRKTRLKTGLPGPPYLIQLSSRPVLVAALE